MGIESVIIIILLIIISVTVITVKIYNDFFKDEYEDNYEAVKKIVFDFGYGYENSSKNIKVFDSLNLFNEAIDYTDIYININKYSKEYITDLFVKIINNPPIIGLDKVKLFVKGKNNNLPVNIHNIIGKDNYITLKNYALEVGQITHYQPYTLSFQFNENIDRSMHIDEVYINTSSIDHEIIIKLNTFLKNNYKQSKLSGIKFMIQDDINTLTDLINNLAMNQLYLFDNNEVKYIKVENIIIGIGANSPLMPSNLSLKFEKDFDLTKKIDIDEIYINTAQNYHQIIEKLITYLMENYTQKEISNMKLFVEGSLDALPLNLKNAIGNNFKI